MSNKIFFCLFITIAFLFIPYPVPLCGTGGIPLHERKTEKSETTAVKPWSFINTAINENSGALEEKNNSLALAEEEKMIERIHWLGHASFYINSPDNLIIYIDPYRIKDGYPQADIILITHDHYDHCSPADIKKISKADTVIVGPKSISGKISQNLKIINPGSKINVKGISIEAVDSYNINKGFHPRSAGNVGYIVTVDMMRIYHAGDTDLIPEMKNIKADIVLLPVGGTYTMDAKEAAQAASSIGATICIPMHFGSVVGSPQDAIEFQKLSKSQVTILKQE
ncbi:MAG: MBL fold metallo-hydrolase [Candidatus Omnitrophota bacterium]